MAWYKISNEDIEEYKALTGATDETLKGMLYLDSTGAWNATNRGEQASFNRAMVAVLAL